MDDINIVAVNGDTPKEWATEATLHQILQLLKGQQKLDKKNDADQIRSLRDIMDGNKNSNSALEKIASEQKKGNDEAKKDRMKEAARYAKSTAEKAGVKTEGPIKGFTDAFGPDGFLGKTLGALAMAMDTFVSAVMSGVNGYNDVYRSGMASTKDSFEQFNAGFLALGVGPEKLSQDLVGYATTINQMGISPIVKSSKALANEFGKFGFTVNDTTVFAANYLERQRLMFNAEVANSNKLDFMQTRAFETTKRYSQVLGVSVEQMEKLQNAQAAEVDQRLATMNMGEIQANEYNAMTTMLREQGMGNVADLLNKVQVVGEAAARATPAASKLLEDMGPEVFNKVLKVGAQIKDGTIKTRADFEKAVTDMANTITDPANKARFLAMYTTGSEAAMQMAVFAEDFKQRIAKTGEDTENGALSMKAAIDTITTLFGSSMNQIFSGVLTKENMQVIADAMVTMTGVMHEFIGSGNGLMKSFSAFLSDPEKIQIMINKMKTFFEELPGMFKGFMLDLKIGFAKLKWILDNPFKAATGQSGALDAIENEEKRKAALEDAKSAAEEWQVYADAARKKGIATHNMEDGVPSEKRTIDELRADLQRVREEEAKAKKEQLDAKNPRPTTQPASSTKAETAQPPASDNAVSPGASSKPQPKTANAPAPQKNVPEPVATIDTLAKLLRDIRENTAHLS